ncbi:MAG: PorV/PorQ family protein [Bacteroidetes bacterium]|nr:PorV/PorQ family protein [Bacteroidota bacterium]
MRTGKIFQISLSVLVLVSCSLAQSYTSNVSKKGTSAASFLSIGQGSRGIAMGSAFVAVADDPSAIFWNPSGIADITGGSVLIEHTQWFADLQYNYVAGTLNLGDIGVVGLSFTASNYDDMPVTTVDYPDGTGETFSVSDVAFSVAYALKLTDKFSIGFNPKFIYQKIWRMNASAAAIDIGVKYVTPFDDAVLAMSISNFGSKMQLAGSTADVFYDPDPEGSGNNGKIPARLYTEEWALPLNFRVGIAYQILRSEINTLTLAFDATHPSDNYESIDAGAEYVFNDFLALRAGYKSFLLAGSEEGMTFGLGVKQAVVGNLQFAFNYAYQDFGRLKNIQKFNIGIIF